MSAPSDRLLSFSSVEGGGQGCWYIYYGKYYVGRILRSHLGWCVWHLEIRLGDFSALEEAKRAVAQWYYGPRAD